MGSWTPKQAPEYTRICLEYWNIPTLGEGALGLYKGHPLDYSSQFAGASPALLGLEVSPNRCTLTFSVIFLFPTALLPNLVIKKRDSTSWPTVYCSLTT